MSIASQNDFVRNTRIKISELERNLEHGLTYCKEFLKDFDFLHNQCEMYKSQLISQTEKCNSNNCNGSEDMKKIIKTKDNIIHSVASVLTKLGETKNFHLISEAFCILFGEPPLMTPPNDSEKCQSNNIKLKENNRSDLIKQENDMSVDDDFLVEESVTEIDGTPTAGRTSPIIQSKIVTVKNKSSNFTTTSDEKKCAKNWPTPETKAAKLCYMSTPPVKRKANANTKLKQTRLSINKVKQNYKVDLTNFNLNERSSPQLKSKESVDSNDDTILPSPTSGPENFTKLYKSKSTLGSGKLRVFDTKVKTELAVNPEKLINCATKIKTEPFDFENRTDIENNEQLKINEVTNPNECKTNLNDPLRSIKNKNRQDKSKTAAPKISHAETEDVTLCDVELNISLSKHIEKLESNRQEYFQTPQSSARQPLAENKNATNVEMEASMSIINRNYLKTNDVQDIKLKKPENVEPVHKEVLPRKKLEKLALPGWSCDECKNFYGELYKDNHEMLLNKMNECSKHRGKQNPIRPRTPPDFWHPRWSIPTDTEEFNKRNNAT